MMVLRYARKAFEFCRSTLFAFDSENLEIAQERCGPEVCLSIRKFLIYLLGTAFGDLLVTAFGDEGTLASFALEVTCQTAQLFISCKAAQLFIFPLELFAYDVKLHVRELRPACRFACPI